MKKVLIISLTLLSLLGVISLFGIDLKVSSIVYSATSEPNWIYSKGKLWDFLYHYGNLLPNTCGIVASLLLIIGVMVRSELPIFSRPVRRKLLFVVLLFLIAPGLIVQTSKVTWGRPRPVEVKQFGGAYEFKTPFEPNFGLAGDKNNGNSFPSGHAANAFYMIFPFYVAKRRKALIFGCTGVAFGILMAVTRIVQGGHFLSDVVTSAFIVYITAEVLKILLLDKPIKE